MDDMTGASSYDQHLDKGLQFKGEGRGGCSNKSARTLFRFGPFWLRFEVRNKLYCSFGLGWQQMTQTSTDQRREDLMAIYLS